MVGGSVLLAAQGACLAGTEDASPAPAVASASAANANPYSVIIARNVFRLNPPPPPPEPAKPPSPHLPVVILSGFMRIGNQWKVLLAVNTENPDPHGQRLTSYLALAEGDKGTVGLGTKQAVVELVKLYVGQEKVDIINSGASITLSMKDNGFNNLAGAQPTIARNSAETTRRNPGDEREMTPAMRFHLPLTEEEVIRAQENPQILTNEMEMTPAMRFHPALTEEEVIKAQENPEGSVPSMP